MQKKNFKASLRTLLLLALISSCAKVKISDSEFCGDMGQEGATCFRTISGQLREVSPSEWESERFGQICTRPETFAEWKAAILKLCKMTKRCTFEVKSKVKSFGHNVDKIRIKINEN